MQTGWVAVKHCVDRRREGGVRPASAYVVAVSAGCVGFDPNPHLLGRLIDDLDCRRGVARSDAEADDIAPRPRRRIHHGDP